MTLAVPSTSSTAGSRRPRRPSTKSPTPASSSSTRPVSFRPPRYGSPQQLIAGKLPPTFGPLVARWIETHLVHGEGDALGQPIRLDPFQRYILNRKYEYDPISGRLLYDRCLFGLPKGNAKTELMASDGLAELAGPIAPVSPHVVVSAASWEQANRLFGAARTMLEEGPLAEIFAGHILEDRISRPDRPGVMTRIAAIAGTNDGGLPTAHYGDEVHEWDGERRERVYVVMGNGLKKRLPRAVLPEGRVRLGGQQVGITTAGDDPTAVSDTPSSLLAKLYAHGVKVAAGDVVDRRFLFLWWEAGPEHDLETDEGLRAAILEANPAAGSFLPLENLVERFRDPTTARYEFERYHLNRWVSPPDAWITMVVWKGRRHPDLMVEPAAGTTICLGFDGSKSRDSTSLKGATLEGHVFAIKTWERPAHDPDWTVPRGEVDAELERAFATWDVRLLQADPPRWERELEDWTTRWPGRVLAFDTAVAERFAPACGRFHDGVTDGTLTHDGDPIHARHISNARTRETRWGLVITKEHKDSPRRIDDAVAGVLAYDGISAPPAKPQNRTLYTW